MNFDKRAILIGMVLGDGSFKKSKYKEQTYVEFQVSHTDKQEEYIRHKAKLLCSVMGGKEPNVNKYFSKTPYGDIHYFKFSKQHKYFNLLYKWIYPSGKKYFTRFLLDKLTPHSIALWYMDDGGLSKSQKTNVWSCEMRFSTYFSEEEADIFIAYFLEKWGIQAKKRLSKKTNSYYMAFNTKESRKLEQLIEEFIIPSMRYKLPSYWNPRALDTCLTSDDIV